VAVVERPMVRRVDVRRKRSNTEAREVIGRVFEFERKVTASRQSTAGQASGGTHAHHSTQKVSICAQQFCDHAILHFQLFRLLDNQ
jgi:hypothetical protein